MSHNISNLLDDTMISMLVIVGPLYLRVYLRQLQLSQKNNSGDAKKKLLFRKVTVGLTIFFFQKSQIIAFLPPLQSQVRLKIQFSNHNFFKTYTKYNLPNSIAVCRTAPHCHRCAKHTLSITGFDLAT